jgi:hypothetical protein
MRKFLLGAAALAGIVAPSVAAAQDEPQNIAYVGLDYANVDIEDVGSEDALGISASGLLAKNFVVDVAIANSEDATAWGATGHLFWNNDQFLLGGFLGVGSDGDIVSRVGGVEGQLYLGRATLAGAVGYAGGDETDSNTVSAEAEARFFLTDNFRIAANGGWIDVDEVGEGYTYGASAEYQLSAAPISIGVGYSHGTSDDTDEETDSVLATLRYNFGGSLLVRDRAGVGLAGLGGL